MSQNTFFDTTHGKFVITSELCNMCHISRDGYGREGVTPYAVACYVYHSLATLKKKPIEIKDALMNKWDKFYWGDSPINLRIWNHLFNGQFLSEEEWQTIWLPSKYIDSVKTSLTSPARDTICHLMNFTADSDTNALYFCSEECYQKFVVNKTSEKGTFYKYGELQGWVFPEEICEGLRKEVTKVTIPFKLQP